MLTLGSGVLEVAYWVSGRAKGTSAYFTSASGGYTAVFSIGQIAGDVEFDINYQEREFYGQFNFPIMKAHFGGKVEARARQVELNVNSLKNFFKATEPLRSSALPSQARSCLIQTLTAARGRRPRQEPVSHAHSTCALRTSGPMTRPRRSRSTCQRRTR